jgi:zinc protease
MKHTTTTFRTIARTITALILLLASAPLFAEGIIEEDPDALPIDPKVRIATLDNGLTYYVRENEEPEDRAVLRLVLDAGSILEDEDQLGLAHFAEHMAFNGTEKYRENEIIEYIESMGMTFGPDLNAHVSFDETVYKLTVPTDDLEELEKGIEILEQWAHKITFDQTELDKERGVILEEWRSGRGAQARIRDQQFPILFADSRYATRLPIGEPEVIETFERPSIVRYYDDWYRPELMAVIAVGDFDADTVETWIQDYFGRIPASVNPREREYYRVPDHRETRFAIAADPELPRTTVALYNKRDIEVLRTHEDYRQSLVHQLFSIMMNARFSEIAQEPDAPFIAAGAGRDRLVRTKGIDYLIALVEAGREEDGLSALVTEAGRVLQYGFTETELERARKTALNFIDQAYNDRENTDSTRFVDEYKRNFLEDETIPGIEYERTLFHRYIPEIQLKEVNAIAEHYLRDSNRVVMVSAVARDGQDVVGERRLQAALDAALTRELEPYQDEVGEGPLVADPPSPGTIESERSLGEISATELTLSNGATVVLKKTDFKNDEVLFTAYSFGGTSLVPISQYESADHAAAIVDQSGLGTFSRVALEKKLSGQTVSLTPYISELDEGMRGSSSVKDLETLFQLIHLSFTDVRRDEEAFETYLRNLRNQISNRENQPFAVFSDTVTELLYQDHPRRQPLSEEEIAAIDLDEALQIYRSRFADADDFTFFFVGNFDEQTIRAHIERYIASLPSRPGSEEFADVGVDYPDGVITDEVYKGVEPASQVAIIFHGPYEWNRTNNHHLQSLAAVMDTRLREVIREDESGTYGIGAFGAQIRYPRERFLFQIVFGTDPDRVEELVDRVFDVIEEIKSEPLEERYIENVRETQRREYETGLKQNEFWRSNLRHVYFHGREPGTILTLPDYIESLSAEDVQQAARRHFPTDSYVQVVLYPESRQSE